MKRNPSNFVTYKFSEQFDQICQPIFKNSPITFCTFARIFTDSTYTAFMSNPAWTSLYIKKHYFSTMTDWAEHQISQAKNGFNIWSQCDFFTKNSDTQKLYRDCNLFQYNNGINIIDQYKNFYEVITFASPRIDGIEKDFIKEQHILRKYILYIKDKILSEPLLASEFNSRYMLPRRISITTQPKFKSFNYTDIDINKFYLGFPLPENAYLTKREIDCLLPFILGIPKKIIAKHLNISTRTIETHLENIKAKCQCTDLMVIRLLFSNNKFISEMLTNLYHEYFVV